MSNGYPHSFTSNSHLLHVWIDGISIIEEVSLLQGYLKNTPFRNLVEMEWTYYYESNYSFVNLVAQVPNDITVKTIDERLEEMRVYLVNILDNPKIEVCSW